MVRVPVSGEQNVDSRPIKLVLCCFSQHKGVIEKSDCLWIRIMFMSETTCLHTGLFVQRVNTIKSNSDYWSSKSRHHHHLIECILFLPQHSWKIAYMAQNKNREQLITYVPGNIKILKISLNLLTIFVDY